MKEFFPFEPLALSFPLPLFRPGFCTGREKRERLGWSHLSPLSCFAQRRFEKGRRRRNGTRLNIGLPPPPPPPFAAAAAEIPASRGDSWARRGRSRFFLSLSTFFVSQGGKTNYHTTVREKNVGRRWGGGGCGGGGDFWGRRGGTSCTHIRNEGRGEGEDRPAFKSQDLSAGWREGGKGEGGRDVLRNHFHF